MSRQRDAAYLRSWKGETAPKRQTSSQRSVRPRRKAEVVEQLFEAGADIFRINMSYTSHDGMRERIATIRDIEAEYGRPIGILVDLQGPNADRRIRRRLHH